jgi:uncharacterized membrane protein
MMIHPAIVHFPIALFLSTSVFALLSLFVKKDQFKEIAFWNLLLGVITAIIAIVTGLFAEQNLIHTEEVHSLLMKHKYNGFGLTIAFMIALTWLWLRKNKFGKKEYFLWVTILLIAALLTTYQGWLGGEMVFRHGAGVKPVESTLEMQGNEKGSHSHDKSEEHNMHTQDKPEEHSTHSKDSVKPNQHVHEHDKKVLNSKKQTKIDSISKKKKPTELKDMRY